MTELDTIVMKLVVSWRVREWERERSASVFTYLQQALNTAALPDELIRESSSVIIKLVFSPKFTDYGPTFKPVERWVCHLAVSE